MEDTSYLDELDTIHPEEIASRICGTDLHAAISNGDFKVLWTFFKDYSNNHIPSWLKMKYICTQAFRQNFTALEHQKSYKLKL